MLIAGGGVACADLERLNCVPVRGRRRAAVAGAKREERSMSIAHDVQHGPASMVRALRGVLSGLAFLAVLAPVAFAQGNVVTGTLRGNVVDPSTGAGVATAFVEFLDVHNRVRASVVADGEGAFVLADLPAGSFRLRASRIGYTRTVTPYWRLESGDVLTVVVYVDPDAVLLAPLEITARERSRSPVLSAYYNRAERGLGGTFITREEIERRHPSLVSDLLADVPGVRLTSGGIGANSRVVTIPRNAMLRGGQCPVQIWVDGMLVTRGAVQVSIDELATPETLEGIEIFRGLATIPPEFVTPEARCGVVALWTRRGG